VSGICMVSPLSALLPLIVKVLVAAEIVPDPISINAGNNQKNPENLIFNDVLTTLGPPCQPTIR